MSDVVIRAEGLGKKYLIGHEADRGGDVTFRDTIMRGVSRMKRSAGDLVRGRPLILGDEVEEFWALKDVNFEIRSGEVVGIIGRNGAGKSTLLKVLSRITEPTEGRVTIEGRVASLLEVGTGFHPELSGRENIYLNGSILGMTRKEIQSKFDEIVDFAGVEKFIDTPVKRYSSGMKVRLGFSVAAHLEPEILIVDEILAVGDAEFQKKCLGKMQDVAGHGRTVLFVSHNMAAVRSLCSRCIFLRGGNLQSDGRVQNIVEQYMADGIEFNAVSHYEKHPQKVAQVLSWRLHAGNSELTTTKFDVFQDIVIDIEFSLSQDLHGANFAFNLDSSDGTHVLSTQDHDTSLEWAKRKPAGVFEVQLRIPAPLLNTGRYYGRISVGIPGVEVFDVVKDVSFEVEDRSGNPARQNRSGHIITKTPWQVISHKPNPTVK